MPLKSILAVLRGDDGGRRSLEHAALLASRHAAHLEALHVGSARPSELPELPSGFPRDHREEALAMLLTQRTNKEQLAWTVFEEVCRRHGFVRMNHASDPATATARWHATVGDTASAVAERGRVFDLVVIDPHGSASGEPPDYAVESALFGTGRPVLLASSSASADLFRRPLVAWNRGMLAARALGAALPFLERAQEAVIVYAETQAKPGPSPEEAAAYLARHGVRAEVNRIPIGRQSVGEALLKAAHDVDADVLVTGAAYHSRVRDLLFGGVTGHMLKHASMPVLMAH
jgi:nucleotide-binding universal stress UspA family protein